MTEAGLPAAPLDSVRIVQANETIPDFLYGVSEGVQPSLVLLNNNGPMPERTQRIIGSGKIDVVEEPAQIARHYLTNATSPGDVLRLTILLNGIGQLNGVLLATALRLLDYRGNIIISSDDPDEWTSLKVLHEFIAGLEAEWGDAEFRRYDHRQIVRVPGRLQDPVDAIVTTINDRPGVLAFSANPDRSWSPRALPFSYLTRFPDALPEQLTLGQITRAISVFNA